MTGMAGRDGELHLCQQAEALWKVDGIKNAGGLLRLRV